MGDPKHPIEALGNPVTSNIQSVSEHAQMLLEIYRNAKEIYQNVRERRTAQVAKKYQEPSYVPGDMVLVSRELMTDPYSRS